MIIGDENCGEVVGILALGTVVVELDAVGAVDGSNIGVGGCVEG